MIGTSFKTKLRIQRNGRKRPDPSIEYDKIGDMKGSRYLPVAVGFFLFVFSVAGVGSVAAQQDAQPQIISSAEFKLSAEAEAAGIDGSLRIRATIDKDGTVKSPEIIAGLSWPCGENPKEILKQVRKDILDTLLAAKFAPAMKNGKPVEKDVLLTYAIGKDFRQAERKRAMDEAKASGKPLPMTVNGGVLNGKAISLPKPGYPEAAKSNGVGGAVSVQVLIDEQGKVITAGAVSGHPILHDAARDAACGPALRLRAGRKPRRCRRRASCAPSRCNWRE